jgi:hypothetical protein
MTARAGRRSWQPRWVDRVEKGADVLGLARHLSIRETALSVFAYGSLSFGLAAGAHRLQVRRDSPSYNAGGRHLGPRPPDMLCQRLQVLHDGCEVELVARAGEAAQAHALESMVGLQVRKAHLDLLALVA